MSQRGWFLIYAALIIWASTSMCLIKPKLWLVGLTFGAMCLMYAWMWLLGKVGLKVDMAFARQRGLTSSSIRQASQPFDLIVEDGPFRGRSKVIGESKMDGLSSAACPVPTHWEKAFQCSRIETSKLLQALA
jgi:hypothetical protein